MAQKHYKAPFEKALLQFITEPDPRVGSRQKACRLAMGSEFILARAAAGSGIKDALLYRFADSFLTAGAADDMTRGLANILASIFIDNAAREIGNGK